MEKNSLLTVFEVLSSKIIGCFLSKNIVSIFGFFKFEDGIIIDSQEGLGKIKNSLVHYSMIIILCFSGLFMSTIALAQSPPSQPSDCKTGCTSNDVQIQRAYLVDVNGIELPPNFTCQGITTVRLALELTTKTPRVGVVIFANVKDFTGNVIGQTILANPKECFGITLNQPTNTVKFTQTFGWTCGTPIVLTNVFIGWGTGNTDFCAGSPNFRCPATSSKCYSLPPGQYITVQIPTANPTEVAKCSTDPGGNTAIFNLTSLNSTVIGSQTNVTVSWFLDAALTTAVANPSSFATVARDVWAKVTSNTPPNPYTSTKITLTVNQTPNLTITNPAAVCSPATVDLTAVAVTSGSILPIGTTLSYWTNPDGTGPANNPAGAGTYYIKATTNTTPACFDIKPVTVTVHITPDAPALSIVQPTCANANGTVTVTSPVGGDFEYSNGGAFQASPVFTVAAGASYSITVKKLSSGCISTATAGAMGAQPITPIPATVSLVQPTCANASGTVTITSPVGGDFEYSNDGAFQASPIFTVAAGASYSIAVKKLSSGCISTATAGAMGMQPATPIPATVSLVQPTCANANGTVTVTSPVGGDFEYSNGGAFQASPVFTVAASASYSITVKKLSSGCISTATTGAMDIQPATPDAPTFCVALPSLCDITKKGSLTILTPIGAAGVYEYSINNGTNWQAGTDFNNLDPGSVTGVKVKRLSTDCISSIADCDESNICSPPSPSATKTTALIAPKEAVINNETPKVGFEAYPVPFKDMLTIRYNFDYVSDVKIEVFNSQGIRVLSKIDTNSYLNKEIALDLRLNKGNEQVYVVKLTTNRGSSVKKVISSR